MKALIAFAVAFAAAGQTVYKDLFVYRTGNAVFSLNKLENYSHYLKDINCFYPGSLTHARYGELANTSSSYFDTEVFKIKNEGPEFRKTTAGFLALSKMIRYASSQSVSVSSDLPKAFRLAAKNAGCSLRGFEGDDMKEEMRKLVLLEVFLRSRFAPDSKGELDEKRKKTIVESIRSLEESVGNQIEHEILRN